MFRWGKSYNSVATQTTEIDHWILRHGKMRPYAGCMGEIREMRAQTALKRAMQATRAREDDENSRIKGLELMRENACLRLAADALIKNIKRQQLENNRTFFDANNPQWLATNFWKVKYSN